jgi:hypothetical protein
MPVARLVAVALVVCSSFAFSQTAQEHLSRGVPPSDADQAMQFLSSLGTVTPAPSEPWRIIPEQAQQGSATQPAPSVPLNDQAKLDAIARALASIPFDPKSQRPWVKVSPDGKIIAMGVVDDTTCYSIRSYQVARDGKDSDATHAVGESTCLPSSRYGVHTAEQHVKLSNGDDLR